MEASGGIGLEDLAAIAATGVDFISLGLLTTRPPLLDISLEVRLPCEKPTTRTSRTGRTRTR